LCWLSSAQIRLAVLGCICILPAVPGEDKNMAPDIKVEKPANGSAVGFEATFWVAADKLSRQPPFTASDRGGKRLREDACWPYRVPHAGTIATNIPDPSVIHIRFQSPVC
jgi:hypothetical protein